MKRIVFIIIACSCIHALWAQTITTYTCDFESSVENAQWVLNASAASRPLSEFPNKWYIGTAGGFGVGSSASSSGLYISSGIDIDTLVSSYSHSKSEFVTASRDLQLAAGTYSVVFDWEAMGSAATDGIYVFWVEGTSTLTFGNYSDRTSLSLPAYVTNSTRLGGALTWRSSAFTFSTSGNGGKLVVLWLNSLTPAQEPAGKVDNICIYQGTQCPMPTNVRYNGTTKSISWSGNAASYDVMLYNYHTQTMSSFTGVTGNSMQMPDFNEEGYYYIYVRANCDVGHSVWAYTEKFIWIKGARCIDLFDLTTDNSGAAKCYWTNNSDYDSHLYDNSGQVLDPNGAESELSRHVIHYRIGETDPRTENQLKTIPDGEVASIRINGFWESAGYHASTIEYDYPVQAGMSDLLILKFACVLQNPNHNEDEQPRFKLDILQGNRVVSTCAQKDFKPGFGAASSWHKVNEGTYEQVDWCDWQTVTVSLRDYVGSTLKIRLTAYDCTLSGHYGYAYFTLNCMSGDLQGIACGDFSTDHFEAPEGFNYRWYREDDPSKSVRGVGQRFNIERDDPTVYLVDVIDRSNPRCFYTLEANPNPRFPQAKASTLSSVGTDCSNKVEFVPECRVVRINRQTLDSVFIDEPVESVLWDFGDGSAPVVAMESRVTHAYPAEGGDYDVTVTAGMSSGVCEDSHTFRISLPNITTPDSHDTIHYCEEGTDRVDTVARISAVGCDYHEYHHHFYHPRYDTTYVDRICEGGRYLFPGDSAYYEASIDTTLQLTSHYGCDSIISLHLVVDPRLDVEYPKTMQICSDDHVFEMPYRVLSGVLDSVKMYFSDRDQQRGFLPCYSFASGEDVLIPLPAEARPDNYDVQLEFGGERCPMDMQHLTFMLTYSSSVVMQNGGFIAVQNADYNGGFEFDSYAWYKDGDALNVNASYIPTSPEDMGSTYTIFLTRKGEDYGVWTCPIVYNPYTQGVDELSAGASLIWPTYVHAGGNLWLAPSHACTVYSILGEVVGYYPQSESQRTLAAPAQKGLYLVVFDNHQSVSIIVY